MIMHGARSPSVKYRPLPVFIASSANHNKSSVTSAVGALWKRLHLLKVILAVGLVLTIVNLFNYRFDMKLDRLSFLRISSSSSTNNNSVPQLQSLQSPNHPFRASSSTATLLNVGPKRLRPIVELKTQFDKPPTPGSSRHAVAVDEDNALVTRTIISMTNSGKSIVFTDNSTAESKPFTSLPPPLDDNHLSVTEEQQPSPGEQQQRQESVPKELLLLLHLNSTTKGSSAPSPSPRVPQKERTPTNNTNNGEKTFPERPKHDQEPLSSSTTGIPVTTTSPLNPKPDNVTELKTDPTPMSRIKFSGYIETTSSRSVTFLSKLMTKLGLNACPEDPPDLHGPLEVNLTKDTVGDVETRLRPFLLPGGWYRPVECNAGDRVAIIIPFRDREQHLPILLKNLHPMLMRQQVNYGIFVVEETKADPFNRASLMNVGFLEANKMANWDCFIFHDVDLIPLDDRNLYRCPEQPRHMSVAIDVFDYKLPYFTIFGGVSALTKQQFHSVNGFSNLFWGWGGEDDDMSNRLRFMGYHISRYPMNIARYTMLSHAKALPNPKRYEKLSNGLKRYENDGLNSVKYQLVENKKFPLFTWLLVKLQPESIAGKLEAQTAADDQHTFLKYSIVLVLATILVCIFKALLCSS